MHRGEGASLAQKPGRRLRWAVALSTIPLFGIVAAFGIAPSTEIERRPVVTVIDNLELAPAPAARPALPFVREERVQRGDTVAALLARLGVEDGAAAAELRAARNARTLRQLVPGRAVSARTTEAGALLSLRYLGADGTEFLALREGGGLAIHERPAALEARVLMQSGEIRSSLFGATDAAGLPDAVALQLADIFASDIDFHRDLRRGDRFSVVYEMLHAGGEPLRPGRVLAAEFVNQGKAFRAVWFEAGETRGYYTPDGRNLRKAFLRSPLEFSRVSSGFSKSRFHPVLKEWRAHRGIDYAAPTGTRVRATADGVVEFAGRQGGYGNLVVLRHAGRYSTAYGHLNGFAKGVRRGARVAQGDIIGYVGQTGLASGPHLHYEFRVDGQQRNPLTVALPAALPVPTQLKAEFDAAAVPRAARLALLAGTNLARLD